MLLFIIIDSLSAYRFSKHLFAIPPITRISSLRNPETSSDFFTQFILDKKGGIPAEFKQSRIVMPRFDYMKYSWLEYSLKIKAFENHDGAFFRRHFTTESKLQKDIKWEETELEKRAVKGMIRIASKTNTIIEGRPGYSPTIICAQICCLYASKFEESLHNNDFCQILEILCMQNWRLPRVFT